MPNSNESDAARYTCKLFRVGVARILWRYLVALSVAGDANRTLFEAHCSGVLAVSGTNIKCFDHEYRL